MTYRIELALNGGTYAKTRQVFVTVDAAQMWIVKAHKGRAYRIVDSETNSPIVNVPGKHCGAWLPKLGKSERYS